MYYVSNLDLNDLKEIIGGSVCLFFSNLNIRLHIYIVKLNGCCSYIVFNNNEFDCNLALADLFEYLKVKGSFDIDFNTKLGVCL